MARVKIQYSYRKFYNSRLATFVDYITHHPLWSTFLGFALFTPLLTLTCSLTSICPEVEVLQYLLLALVLASFVLFISGAFWVRLLSDKLDLAGRIARKTLEKQRKALLAGRVI